MGKRLPTTPRGQVKQILGRLWLRSRERAAALKRDHYTCQECGRKQSVAKGREVAVQVHHLHPGGTGMEMERLVGYVYEHMLCSPDHLTTLCKECHEKETDRLAGK
jgi:5-methylcytosine-specific restriction endonuclease McrA